MTELETKLAEALRHVAGVDCQYCAACTVVHEALAAYDAAKAKKPNKDMDWHLEPEEMDP